MSLSPKEITRAFQSVPLFPRIIAKFLLQSVSTVGTFETTLSVVAPLFELVDLKSLGDSNKSRFSPDWKAEDACI